MITSLHDEIYAAGDLGDLDSHIERIISSINKSISAKDPIFLMLGDNFYPNGLITKTKDEQIEKFRHYFKNLHMPIYGLLGNHDYVGNPKEQIGMKINDVNFNMESNYYKIEKDHIDVFMIDGVILRPGYNAEGKYIYFHNKLKKIWGKDPIVLRSELLYWLENNLEKSNKKWKLICCHYPLLSDGIYKHWNELYKTLMPLLHKYKVNFYFCGHDHNLQYIKLNDLHQFIAGSSSHNHKIKIKKVSSFFANTPGYICLKATKSTASVTIYDENGKTLFVKFLM